MAALLTVMWLGRIGTALSGDLAAAGLTSETTLTIQALDLGFVVPALALSAVLAWRRSPAGYALSTALTVTFVGMAIAIVSMLLSAFLVEGSFEIVPIAIFALAASRRRLDRYPCLREHDEQWAEFDAGHGTERPDGAEKRGRERRTMRALVTVSSKHGGTDGIGRAIAEVLESAGIRRRRDPALGSRLA